MRISLLLGNTCWNRSEAIPCLQFILQWLRKNNNLHICGMYMCVLCVCRVGKRWRNTWRKTTCEVWGKVVQKLYKFCNFQVKLFKQLRKTWVSPSSDESCRGLWGWGLRQGWGGGVHTGFGLHQDPSSLTLLPLELPLFFWKAPPSGLSPEVTPSDGNRLTQPGCTCVCVCVSRGPPCCQTCWLKSSPFCSLSLPHCGWKGVAVSHGSLGGQDWHKIYHRPVLKRDPLLVSDSWNSAFHDIP